MGKKFGAKNGCAKNTEAGWSEFEISACRGAGETWALAKQLFNDQHGGVGCLPGFFVFVDNDFAQGAAAFVNEATAEPIRLYEAGDTFSKEDAVWTDVKTVDATKLRRLL